MITQKWDMSTLQKFVKWLIWQLLS